MVGNVGPSKMPDGFEISNFNIGDQHRWLHLVMELEQQVEGVGGNRVSIGGQLLGGGQDEAGKVQVRNVHVVAAVVRFMVRVRG